MVLCYSCTSKPYTGLIPWNGLRCPGPQTAHPGMSWWDLVVPQCLFPKPQRLLSLDQDDDTSGKAPLEGLTHGAGWGGGGWRGEGSKPKETGQRPALTFARCCPISGRAGTKVRLSFSQASRGFSVAEGADTCLLSAQPETLSSQKVAKGRIQGQTQGRQLGPGQGPAGRKAVTG